MGKLIIRRFRVNASNSSLALGNDVTFKEFVEFLTSPAVSTDDVPYTFNEHWASITNLCHPCTIKYNLIGNFLLYYSW